MKTLTVTLAARSYPIYIGDAIFDDVSLWRQHIKSRQVLVVTNEAVAPLYLDRLMRVLGDFQLESVVLPDGEQYKTMTTLDAIYEQLLVHRFGRQATIIALGGGVVGDMAGFAAACYQRGITFIQMPTTLLAQVDSSVGGKTGVNHAMGKNMIGAFHQPACVVADTQTLETLPAREFSAGLAEVIKYGLIRDEAFFNWLELNMPLLMQRDKTALAYVIEQSCRNKAEVVAADEFETGERATLNLGHTFGHAIETGAGYGTYLHGEAVAIGTCMAADVSRALGWLTAETLSRIEALFIAAKLPITPPAAMDDAQFRTLMSVDKKNVDGDIRLILLKKIGEASLPMPVEKELLTQTLKNYGRK